MTEQSDPPKANAAQDLPVSLHPSAPYEAVLIKAFNRLTSEVFIFLLAYLILIIGLAVLAPGLTSEVRTLLYILPVLGIGAYSWQKRRALAGQAKLQGIDVWAGIVTGEAKVRGFQAPAGAAGTPQNVKVTAGFAGGKGAVEGVVIGDSETGANTSDAHYLLETFQKLNPPQRARLITTAEMLLKEA
jgi:hypothetical protein